MGEGRRGRIGLRELRLPRLYAIIDDEMLQVRGLDVFRFSQELRDAGVTLVQYRNKRAGRDPVHKEIQEEVLRSARVIAEVFRGIEATLVMNDSPLLAMLSDWNAVHVGQGDASVREARIMLPPGGIVGCSTHSDEQVIAADVAGADYIAIGPVFATATKSNAEAVVGLEGVRRARALTRRPLVAIGGITEENAASVIEAGADSVAVIGALLKASEHTGEIVKRFMATMPA